MIFQAAGDASGAHIMSVEVYRTYVGAIAADVYFLPDENGARYRLGNLVTVLKLEDARVWFVDTPRKRWLKIMAPSGGPQFIRWYDEPFPLDPAVKVRDIMEIVDMLHRKIVKARQDEPYSGLLDLAQQRILGFKADQRLRLRKVYLNLGEPGDGNSLSFAFVKTKHGWKQRETLIITAGLREFEKNVSRPSPRPLAARWAGR
jgi:hypothetical protein